MLKKEGRGGAFQGKYFRAHPRQLQRGRADANSSPAPACAVTFLPQSRLSRPTARLTVCGLFRVNMSRVAFTPSSNQRSPQCQTSNHAVRTMGRVGLCVRKPCRRPPRLRSLPRVRWAPYPVITAGAGFAAPVFALVTRQNGRGPGSP